MAAERRQRKNGHVLPSDGRRGHEDRQDGGWHRTRRTIDRSPESELPSPKSHVSLSGVPMRASFVGENTTGRECARKRSTFRTIINRDKRDERDDDLGQYRHSWGPGPQNDHIITL